MEHIVMSNGEIEKMAWCDARRVVVVILLAGCGDPQQTGGELRRGARAGQSDGGRCAHTVTTEASLKFLVGSEASGRQIYDAAGVREWGRTCNQSAVVTPVETEPRPGVPGLILHVGCLVELLVMVDTEDSTRRRGSGSRSPQLREEVAGRHAGEDHERGKSMEVWYANPPRECWNFVVMPLDREGDGRSPQDAEVVGPMRVLPDVLAGEDKISSERLLDAGVEFVAPARCNRVSAGPGAPK